MDALAKLAVAGTSRSPNAAVRSDLPTDPLINSLTIDSLERRLLLSAGVGSLYRLAGQRPLPAPPALAAAPAESRPACSAKVAQLLIDLVGAKQIDLAIEAAWRLDAAGQRVPHDILPVLLDVTDASLRAALLAVLGERGRWLAPFNPDWLWVASKFDELPDNLSDLETIWNEGTLAARAAVLTRLHKVEPERARDWLSQVWPKEKAEPRAELLAVLGPSLTPDDEPFIEGILDDRSMAVRMQAARLLARIPNSRLSQRMIARADAMLAYEPPKSGMLSKLKKLAGDATGALSVAPPQEIDAAWERDGIPAKPPQGVGKRTYWLSRVLSLVPLQHWQQRFGVAPDILLAAARETEWWETLVIAWTEAAQACADPGWRMALWHFWLDLFGADIKAAQDRHAFIAGLPAMLRAMPRRDAEACLVALLNSSAPIGHVIVIECLRGLEKPWSAEFSARCLARLRQEATAPTTAPRGAAVDVLPIAARAIPADCFTQALAPWLPITGEHYIDKSWQREIATFIETVQLRKTLIEETAS